MSMFEGPRDPALFGASPALKATLETLASLALSNAPVLVLGERHTGVDAFARELHARSPNAAHPLNVLDGATLPSTPINELLASHSGSVLLRGIDALSLENQGVLVELVRNAQPGLIVAAEETVITPQLHDAFGGRCLLVPSIRDRLEDIPILARYFTELASQERGAPLVLGSSALRALQAYRFPGNLLELQTLVDKLAVSVEQDPPRGGSGQFRVPVLRERVQFRTGDGAQHDGYVFRVGGQPVESLFDAAEPFLPVDEGGHIRLYARASLAVISVPCASALDSGMPLRTVRVSVRLRSGHILEGELRYPAETARTRAVDYLNSPASSFIVFCPDQAHHVAKAFVEVVEEVR
ncbi:MAG: sigma 54-interacting transcriptional regulator [Myxococcales bacterium]